MDVSNLIRKEALRQGLRPKTMHIYCQCVHKFLYKCNKEPFSINQKDIRDYVDTFLERNAPGNTINVYLNAIKFFYEDVLHRKLTLDIKYSKIPQKLPVFLTQDEVIKLFEAITYPKHKLMITFLYSTGMRIGELLNLKVKDLELKLNYGWVRDGKGGKDRLFIIAEKLKIDLSNWIQENNLQTDNFLFEGEKGGAYSDSSVREILKFARRKAGIKKKVHPHMLRHSFATHLIQNGYAVTEVQPLLGHSSLNTTMIYVHMAAPNLLKVKSPFDNLEVST